MSPATSWPLPATPTHPPTHPPPTHTHTPSYVAFRNSELICGRLGKVILGGNKGGLFYTLASDCSPDAAAAVSAAPPPPQRADAARRVASWRVVVPWV
jgi:hypothetical protein